MLIIRFLLIVVLCVAMHNAEDLLVGSSANAQIVYSETVILSAVPFTTRIKNVFFNSSNATKIIKGLQAIDIDKTKARPIITAGGVGSTYVNLKIKSKRGDGLNYLIQIFA